MPDQPLQKKRAVLRSPAYLSDFRCIGAECTDPCCYGWDIFVDKPTYLRYRDLPASGLGKKIRKAVRPNRKDPSDAHYARIHRKGDTCPFLTPDGLCRIHAELGEDSLPDTCAVFPRHRRARKDGIDISASLACPEIARRALEPARGIEIIESDLDPSAADSLRGVEPGKSPEIEAAGRMLQDFAIPFLQDRTHSLWMRVLALGLLLEKIGSSKASWGAAALPSMLDEFSRRMGSGELVDWMEHAPTLTHLQLQLVKRLHDELMPGVKGTAFKECADECLAGLGYTDEQGFPADLAQRYDAAFARDYRPFFERYGFMLENYLVSHLLHHELGFQQGRRLYEDYILMVLHFAMIKTYLIGMSAWHGASFHPAAVVKLIYSFTKAVEPDARFRDYALGILSESGCTDMMHLAVLIKN